MTAYGAQIARAQAKIKARGQLVLYTPASPDVVANDPRYPFQVGISNTLLVDVGNLVNAALAGMPGNATPVPDDPNSPQATRKTYMLFLDAKARGSSTQGMAAEMISRTDVVGGNKLGLLAGGQNINVTIGDTIDRNTEGRTGYPLYKVAKLKTLDVDGAVILYTIELEL